MAKVYVVTGGDYSSYHIEGIFSTYELAQEFMDKGGFTDMEEYDLDGRKDEVSTTLYKVWLDPTTGNLIEKEIVNTVESIDRNYSNCSASYCYAVSLKSEEHALKLAAEARQAYLREAPTQNSWWSYHSNEPKT